MPHYFSESNDTLKSNPKQIAFSVNDIPLKFKTDIGVFSKDGYDRGTEVLLSYLEVEDTVKKALDLGCGYGVVGVYLAKRYDIKVYMVDVNKRAINLATENVLLNSVEADVFLSDGFENIRDEYDLIISNPPIRAGKDTVYKFFTDARNYLTKDGSFVIVINKKHGAESAIRKLQTIYQTVEIVKRKKGFNVIKCKK